MSSSSSDSELVRSISPPLLKTLYFHHPGTMTVSGPTGCGKTHFVKRLIQHSMFRDDNDRPINRVIWFHGTAPSDELIDKVTKYTGGRAEFYRGVNEDLVRNGLDEKENNLIVIDDLMQELSDKKILANLFTKGSHHSNCSVVYIVQNLFDRGRASSTVAKNSHYTVVFKNERALYEIRSLAPQVLPAGRGRDFTELFDRITQAPFSYLVLDCHPRSNKNEKFRTAIFPGEESKIFVPNQ